MRRSYGATNNYWQQYRYISGVTGTSFCEQYPAACTFNPQGDIFAWLNNFLTALHTWITELIQSKLPANYAGRVRYYG